METENRLNEQWWIDNYNTKLSKKNEKLFQDWLDKQRTVFDSQTDSILHYKFRPYLVNYDLRGWWKYLSKNPKENDFGFYWEGKFDKPCCPTFSTESIYHGQDGFYGGKWKNTVNRSALDVLMGPDEFYPSTTNIELVGVEKLIERFAGVPTRLVLPEDIQMVLDANRETDINLH